MNVFQFYDAAMWRVALSFGGDKTAHLYVGMAIWLGSAVLFRQPLRDVRPPIVLISLEAINEVLDRAAKGSWRWPDTSADIIHSLFWPLVIFACLRSFAWLRK